ncbi:ATP-dependent DNA ligase [Candidatus Pacearchaeota archaeon]|nr:ATP-dependent DNA ligase [Candidatus Pacearchaeota archaeon]
MLYSEFTELYDKLALTTKKLEKVDIIAAFLPKLKGSEELIYLLRGRVFPDYDIRELGISTKLVIRSLSVASGYSISDVSSKFKSIGDLGDVAVDLLKKKKQNSLFSKRLTAQHIIDSLRKVSETSGDGAVDKKVAIISELLIESNSREACYVVRTLLSDLRIGVADAVLLSSINKAFFNKIEMLDKIERAYDLVNDFAQILKLSIAGENAFEHISLTPGRPLNVMLATKVSSIDEAFEVCGRPAAFEHKYDGFRAIISSDGKKIKVFTRRLEDVTNQFPDVVEVVSKHIKAKNFILDAEAVGFDAKKNKYLPFEAISQRIKRKYDIHELASKMPVELKIFDVLYLNGENKLDIPFLKRRKLIERIVENVPWKISNSTQIVTDSNKEVEKFYKDALKIGEEGIMIKNLNSSYISGRYVGNMAKLKPNNADLDLVIVGAEYGTGKRAGGLTSFIVACKSEDRFVEVGKVSSGLKEKESEGTTYQEIDSLLKPLVISEDDSSVKVKPKIVVSVNYQNIQPSPTYSSGFALRFPRITHYRPERGIHDIATLEDIKKEVSKSFRRLNKKGL